MAHTPGPWKVSWIGREYGPKLNGSYAVRAADDEVVAICPLGGKTKDIRLISKSPDLLEALNELVDAVAFDMCHSEDESELGMMSLKNLSDKLEKARATIAAVEGRS